ncbi:hypothetical protein [Paenibacillus sp. DMB5]|uniref:hypothetical protein n=1 Tax=Paenibacillus sp. DMB5 TaxID=1780103 RepID=UPI00076BD4BA|nr:hypothetical protein [Paenibacillus sp. DMB5]KUP21271.1 hypothetical protein AWJ19_15185 [Paenibacillus sp. DMB5]
MKKEWWKRKKFPAIAGLALVTVVSGCSGSNAGDNGEAGAADDDDKGEITVLYVETSSGRIRLRNLSRSPALKSIMKW